MSKPTTFILQPHHLVLARAMYVSWGYDEAGAPAIDPKRPYGNGDVEHDISDLLGIHWPDEESDLDYDPKIEALCSLLMDIHREMDTVLEIVLSHIGQPLEPGQYCNVATSYGRPQWVRLS
jgi:hypothetical protein